MIYTITLNPALDCALYTDKFVINRSNHYQASKVSIGGKGINVALILNRLGDPVIALAFLGQENSNLFVQKFREERLSYHLFEYPGTTRTNYKIKNLKANEETELDGLSSFLPESLVKDLSQYLETHLKPGDIVVVAGSIPRGLMSDTYRHLGDLIKKKKALFMLDGTKEFLSQGLKAKPYLIKPNLAELKDTFNFDTHGADLEAIVPVVKFVTEQGAQNILLSLGSQGSYFFANDGGIFKVGIAKGKLLNSVGAGDSMLAGFVHGLVNNLPIEETLKYAAAAGGATAFSEELGSKALINQYQPKIKVELVKGTKWK